MEQNVLGFRPRPPFPPRRPCWGGPAPCGDPSRRRDAPGQDQRQGEIISLDLASRILHLNCCIDPYRIQESHDERYGLIPTQMIAVRGHDGAGVPARGRGGVAVHAGRHDRQLGPLRGRRRPRVREDPQVSVVPCIMKWTSPRMITTVVQCRLYIFLD